MLRLEACCGRSNPSEFRGFKLHVELLFSFSFMRSGHRRRRGKYLDFLRFFAILFEFVQISGDSLLLISAGGYMGADLAPDIFDPKSCGYIPPKSDLTSKPVNRGPETVQVALR